MANSCELCYDITTTVDDLFVVGIQKTFGDALVETIRVGIMCELYELSFVVFKLMDGVYLINYWAKYF